MAVAPNPFDEAFIRANFSYQLLPHTRSGVNSADASVAANDSSASLIDPMLNGNDGNQEMPAAAALASTSTSPSSCPPSHQRQESIEDIANAPALVASPGSSLNYEVRQPGQKPMKTVAPIRVPRRSEPGNGSQNGLRSPATGLSSAALTSSFPMPPPRTPGSHSPGTFGSPSASGHGHSHEDSLSSPPRTSSNSPQNTSQRQSPVQDRVPQLPRKMLSVPPPTPALTNSRTSSSLGLYWEGEISSIRNSGSHPAPSAVLPYYSPNPLANPLTPFREEAYARHRSFAAEMSTPLPSGPPSPMYPPRTYSPGGASDVSRKEYAKLAGSPPTHEGASAHSPNGRAPRPSLYRNPSSTSQEWEDKYRRRESTGTFGTAISNVASIGMNQAMDTLESEDFASIGTRTGTHTRTHSEVSITSSPGMTHELVRRGDIFEAHPSSAGLNEASRRLARASLVSSELLRSKTSIDALRSVLSQDPPYAVDDPEGEATNSRPPTGIRHSKRYSSGPAPTLASLAEDEDDHNLPPADLEDEQARRQSRHRNGSKRPSGHMPRRVSDWGSKSTKSYISHKSGKSSAHFTVASHAPSLPTLHKPGKRAEIAVNEAMIPFKKLARRASTLGDILDNMPEHEYTSYSAEVGRDASYDDLNELRYGNQLRKARRKIEVGVPSMWNSHTPMGSVSDSLRDRSMSPGPADGEMREKSSTRATYHVHPGAELDDRHFRRRKSYPASQLQEAMSVHTEKATSSALHGRSSFSSSGSQDDEEPEQPPQKPLSWWQTLPPQKKKRLRLVIVLVIAVLIAIIVGIAVPLSKTRGGVGVDECPRSCGTHGKAVLREGQCICACDESRRGPFCDFDPTCVCPDGSDSCPNRLAKSLVTTASYASSLFAPPIDTTRLAASLARTVGANQDNCASHTQIIGTPNLDPVQYKARRRWVQAVLLWDAAIAEDFTSNKLKDFQAGLSYWQWQDSPSFQAQPAFQITTHGYSVDFAYQKVYVVPKTLTDLGISANVALRLSNSSAEALQKVGAFATAASTQRASALSNLFSELEFGEDQLDVFRSSVLAAPVYFPFDISGSAGSLSAIALASRQKESQGAFPLPQTCIPGLSVSQLAEVNRVEQDIFGLDPATTETEPRTNCTSRPTYGTLNILNFQLPFLDPQASPQAIAISNQDRKRRMTFSTGPTLSPLLRGQAVNTTAVTTASFGISSAIDNVLFEYLVRLQDAALAKALVDYVVSGTKVPPPPSSELYTLSNGLASLPVIEVQLWGNLLFSDVDYVVSGIGQAGGTALFGSQTGEELRNWAHSGSISEPMRWSLDAISSQYALDTGSGGAFQGVWENSRDSLPADIYANLGSSNLLTS